MEARAASSTPALASALFYFPITPLRRIAPAREPLTGWIPLAALLFINAGREKNISWVFSPTCPGHRSPDAAPAAADRPDLANNPEADLSEEGLAEGG
jgi:hypothetical protein